MPFAASAQWGMTASRRSRAATIRSSGTSVTTLTGAGAATQAAQTAAGVGSLKITGTGAPTQADQTAAGTGTYTAPFAPVGYINLGAAQALGLSSATCPTAFPATATRTLRYMCTGGRRDSNTTSAGNLYKGGSFIQGATQLGALVNNRTNSSGDTITTALTAGQNAINNGIGAADSMQAIIALLLVVGYEIKQTKYAQGTSTSPAVTFDAPVGSGREVVVVVHHTSGSSNPVSVPPASDPLRLLGAVQNTGAGGTRPCGLACYALTDMAGASVVPGCTLGSSQVWGYQAIEIGAV